MMSFQSPDPIKFNGIVNLFIFCTTIVVTAAFIMDNFLLKFCAFTTTMIVYTFLNDINYIYDRFGRTTNLKSKLIETFLWLTFEEICFLVYLMAVYVIKLNIHCGDNFACFIGLAATLGTYKCIQALDEVKHQFKNQLKQLESLSNRCNCEIHKSLRR